MKAKCKTFDCSRRISAFGPMGLLQPSRVILSFSEWDNKPGAIVGRLEYSIFAFLELEQSEVSKCEALWSYSKTLITSGIQRGYELNSNPRSPWIEASSPSISFSWVTRKPPVKRAVTFTRIKVATAVYKAVATIEISWISSCLALP